MRILFTDIKVSAIYFIDKKNGNCTITTMEKGGPIISGESFETAKAKFEEAINLGSAATNILFFKNLKKNMPAKRSNLSTSISYLQVA